MSNFHLSKAHATNSHFEGRTAAEAWSAEAEKHGGEMFGWMQAGQNATLREIGIIHQQSSVMVAHPMIPYQMFCAIDCCGCG